MHTPWTRCCLAAVKNYFAQHLADITKKTVQKQLVYVCRHAHAIDRTFRLAHGKDICSQNNGKGLYFGDPFIGDEWAPVMDAENGACVIWPFRFGSARLHSRLYFCKATSDDSDLRLWLAFFRGSHGYQSGSRWGNQTGGRAGPTTARSMAFPPPEITAPHPGDCLQVVHDTKGTCSASPRTPPPPPPPPPLLPMAGDFGLHIVPKQSPASFATIYEHAMVPKCSSGNEVDLARTPRLC
jgi:hypothetical protein